MRLRQSRPCGALWSSVSPWRWSHAGLAVAKKKHHHGKLPRGPYPSLGACSAFPKSSAPANAPSAADESAWNQDISQAPLDPNSAGYIAYINAHGGDSVHPDFGSPPRVRLPLRGGRQEAEADQGPLHGLRRRIRPRRLPRPAEGTGRGRPGLRRRPPRPGGGPEALQALRALPRLRAETAEAPLERGRRRDLGPALRGAADRRLHLGRRRRTADLPGPRPLRRGGLGPYRPRAARHRQLDPGRLGPPRLPLRRVGERPERPSDGPAPAPLGRLRHLRLQRARRARSPSRSSSTG